MTTRARETVDIGSPPETQPSVQELLTTAGEAERRLLKAERKAEKRLADALAELARDQARLRKSQVRVESSRAAVAAAEDALRSSQLRRAAGPGVSSA